MLSSACGAAPLAVCACRGRPVRRCRWPFLHGLGVPWFAARLADLLHTTLEIRKRDGGETTSCSVLEITDFTLFGQNTTAVTLDGAETEKATRGGRKKFMLSGCLEPIGGGASSGTASVIRCRLFQRGPGWWTRMERFVDDGALLTASLTAPWADGRQRSDWDARLAT